MQHVRLPHGAGASVRFRAEARRLWSERVPPSDVQWCAEDDAPPGPAHAAADPADTALQVPRAFSDLADAALLHNDPARFHLLYELLWRLQHEPALRRDTLDPQWRQAELLARAVRRDQHKMRAFVRFRQVGGDGAHAQHVAWFEPAHHVVESQAEFFLQRLANVHWAVLTPLRCMAWDGRHLTFAPGAHRDQAPPADAGEALWLTYYTHIFNPARLKVQAMTKEMPRRYWHNLPEAALIEPLIATAADRSAEMVARPAAETARRWRALPARADPPSSPPRLPDAGASPAQRQDALAATCTAASACTRCPLHAGATQTVFGQGPVDAPLAFVGEQPGDQEDLAGQPFQGPAGALFDRVLRDLGIARGSVYVTNAVKHFKFELRGLRRIHKTPAQHEAAACLDWLERELALVKPRAAVALGATAARALLGRAVAVTRDRGQWFERPDGLRVLVTLHPAALLRDPALTTEAAREAAYAAWRADLAQAAERDFFTPNLPNSSTT